MESLKQQLNEVKTQIKETEELLKNLMRTQEGLEDELKDATTYEDEEKKKLIPWFYNPDIIVDYPSPNMYDISPISGLDEYEQVSRIISENLDFDDLTDYELAFLFGHYMANHLLNEAHDNEWLDEYPEVVDEEYKTYFQMSITFLFGMKIILEKVVHTKGILEGFQRSLKDFAKGDKNVFEILGSEDTIKFLSAITTMDSPCTLSMEVASSKEEVLKDGNQNSKCSLETETKKNVSSLEELVKEKLGI